MGNTFPVRLDSLQPTQLYISAAKLATVLESFDPEDIAPLPVKRLCDRIVITDGHTRAFAAYLFGVAEVPACWDHDEMDWEAYEICVRWCDKEAIRKVGDFVGRVLPPDEYETRWRGRCTAMHHELDEQRKARKKKGA